jgi:hypothetical protein
MNRNAVMDRPTTPARSTVPIRPRGIPSARGWLSIVLSAGVLALGTACSDAADDRSGTATTSGPTQSGSPAATAGAAPGAEGTPSAAPGPPVLADGRHPVYLTDLDLPRRTVTFDLIQFLTGAEATKVWAKQHPDDPEGPPNDYLIVNDNRRLRTLPIADRAEVTVVQTGAASGGVTNVQISLGDLPGHLARQKPETVDDRLSYAPYWLTVRSGQVTRIEEQFLP